MFVLSATKGSIKMATKLTISSWNSAHNAPLFNIFNSFVASNELPASESTYTRLLKGLSRPTIELIKDVVANNNTDKYYSSKREWIELPGPSRRVTPLMESEHVEMGIEVVDPNSEVPWHHHTDTDELFLFLDGEAEVIVTHNEQATESESDSSTTGLKVTALLGPQQSCWVPLGCRHRLVNRSSTAPLRFIYLFSPSPAGGFAATLRKRLENN
eukprot:TRINITY_DN13793_c0_g1_i1.p1 TRINITY_DN13793_c0_g1~~TRINITY_DN13793_c0_g1_i1.p1  ORF type:complete len:214 (-),score=3.85 TRINITY_DN13793_c0_g1_i1:23-664(-)